MQGFIERIVRNDTRARQVIEDVEARRQQEEADLKKQQDAFTQQLEEKNRTRIEEYSRRQREQLTRQLEEKRRSNAAISRQMDELYQRNQEAWVEQIVRNVLKQERS